MKPEPKKKYCDYSNNKPPAPQTFKQHIELILVFSSFMLFAFLTIAGTIVFSKIEGGGFGTLIAMILLIPAWLYMQLGFTKFFRIGVDERRNEELARFSYSNDFRF